MNSETGILLNHTADQKNVERILQISDNIMNIIAPIILVAGTIGNVVCFVAQGSFKKKGSTNTFMRVLAVLNTNVLWFGLLSEWLTSLFGFDIKTQYDFLCKFITFISYSCSISSVWMLVILTLERFIAVYRPLKVTMVFNKRRLPYFIATPIALTFILNAHFFTSVGIVTDNDTMTESCSSNQAFVDHVWPWVDAVLYSFLPCILLIFFNSMIIRKMTTIQKFGKLPLRRNLSGGSFKTIKTTTICVVISVFCLITVLPLNIISIVIMFWNQGNLTGVNLDSENAAGFMLAVNIASLLLYTNHAMNFFLYIFVGSNFRYHVLILLKCRRRPSRPHPLIRRSENVSRNASLVSQSTKVGSIELQNISENTEKVIHLSIPDV